MKVKSKVNTKRLVKGAIYEVMKLQAAPSQNFYTKNRVLIKMNSNHNQWFSISSFTLENGSPIPQIDWTSDFFKMNNVNPWELRITDKNLKAGDYVVYIRNTHSTLVPDRKYKVEDVKVRTYSSSYGNHSWTDIDLKLEGSTRYYKSNSFRICTPDEVRETNLKLVFDETSDLQVVDKKKRNFDFFTEEDKQKMLIEALFKAAVDKNRNNLSVIEWAISRIEPTLKLKRDDFEELLTRNLKSIIDLFK